VILIFIGSINYEMNGYFEYHLKLFRKRKFYLICCLRILNLLD